MEQEVQEQIRQIFQNSSKTEQQFRHLTPEEKWEEAVDRINMGNKLVGHLPDVRRNTMEYIEKIKKMLCRELEEFGEKNRVSGADLEMIWKLTDTVKNLNKIEMLEDGGYSERGYSRGMSYDDDMSYARGRGSNARRDSMGRYSSNSYDNYSENSYAKRYSRDDAKDHMMSKLGEMMDDADPNEREILKQTMRKLEKA